MIAAARRRVIQNLRDQDAYTPGTAAPLDLHRRLERRMLDRLQRSGVVIADGADRYHLNLVALDALEARTRMVTGWTAGILTVGAGMALLIALL